MTKKTQKKLNPTSFTESYQFIQTMFQEPISWRERGVKLLRFLLKGLLVLGLAALFLGSITLLIYFDVMASALTDAGLQIPKRWP